ncbi:MAG: cysteine--tRNA ligase, partial [Ktedonobacterales bacterium]|nr:cysteine--tRNA ligase [Ktedonobacterales bacterium]
MLDALVAGANPSDAAKSQGVMGSRVVVCQKLIVNDHQNRSGQSRMQISNTLSGHKDTFEPISLPVRMYVCGLTPKNEPHLGHARLFVANDVIRRYLEYRGFPVKYVQNFTDIDDKTIAAATREGISPAEVARRYMDGYFRDMDALAVRRADEFTYVTEFMPQIIDFVTQLVAKGNAYVAAGEFGENDVYFATETFAEYGKLSKRNADAMLVGARIEPNEHKHDARDFALWKGAKPGEPWWESPWGRGRPGWHIECSAMAMSTLGEQIDIHGGGTDLIFPHHENEIAQSEALTGKAPFTRYWAHTGLLQLGDEKMAHSGSFVTIRSVLEATPAPALRLYLLAQSYRTNFTYTEENLATNVTRWRRWAEARNIANTVLEAFPTPKPTRKKKITEDTSLAASEVPETVDDPMATLRAEFIAGMDDDFNTSRGVAVVDELVRRLNELATKRDPAQATALRAGLALLDELTDVLGITLDLALDVRRAVDDATRAEIEALVVARTTARAAKDWA